MPFFSAEEDKRSITWGYKSLNHSQVGEKGGYRRRSKAQLKRWGETTCIEATIMWHPVWIFLLLGDYQGGNSTSVLWGFVEWRTSNLSGCLLFLYSLNTPLSGSLCCWESEIKSVYLISGNMQPWESPVTSEWTNSSGFSSTLGLLQSCFFSSRASFSRPSLHPRLFHAPLQSVLSKGNLLFIALCGGMQGRKEEGKTMVSMATRQKEKKKT